MQGVFFGQDQFFDEQGNLQFFCTILIARPEKKWAYLSAPGKCDDKKSLTMEQFISTIFMDLSYIGETYNIICIDQGRGNYMHANGSENTVYACETFQRAGDTLYSSIGMFDTNPLVANCPDVAKASLGQTPYVWYVSALNAVHDHSKNVTNNEYSCQ